jgi:hypothetical protein
MAIDKETLQQRWRVTVAACMAYTAIVTLFFVVTLYHLSPRGPDASRAKVVRSNEPAVQTGLTRLAVAGKVK